LYFSVGFTGWNQRAMVETIIIGIKQQDEQNDTKNNSFRTGLLVL
jgi:hypothetical protein